MGKVNLNLYYSIRVVESKFAIDPGSTSNTKFAIVTVLIHRPSSSVVERRTEDPSVGGSNPPLDIDIALSTRHKLAHQ